MGNKLDLAAARQVTVEEGQSYAEEANLLFTEASARTGDNVTEAFNKIARKLPKTEQQMASPRMTPDTRRVDLGRGGVAGSRTSTGCC